MRKEDHSLPQRVALRRSLLATLEGPPYVLDAFAGTGEIYKRLYRDFPGCAIERKEVLAERAARMRPRWSVACGDAPGLLASGLFDFRAIDFFDLDGGPSLDAALAILRGERRHAARFLIVATDRLNVRRAFPVECASEGEEEIITWYDAHLYRLLKGEAAKARLGIAGWRYYTSEGGRGTALWAAEFRRAD
jgi:hypothetical protein